MRITIEVPDNTTSMRYDTKAHDGHMHMTHDVTLDMIVKIEREEAIAMIDVFAKIEQDEESSRGGK